MRKKDAEASVTVFFSMLLVCCFAFLLALAEAARYEGMEADAREWTELAAESLCACYEPEVFSQYGLFLLDLSFGSGEISLQKAQDWMQALLVENSWETKASDGSNVWRLCPKEVTVQTDRRITDDSGRVFEKQTAACMKQEIGRDAAQRLLRKFTDAASDETQKDPEQVLKDGEDTLILEKQQQAQNQATQADGTTQTETPPVPPAEPVQNPFDAVKPARATGILALILPQGTEISGKKRENEERAVSERTLKQGNAPAVGAGSWYERILMQEYLRKKTGSYQNPAQQSALSYGMEYLIAAKDSDEENLKSVAGRLLLLRETINFAYLQTDGVKRQEALAVAASLAGAAANPLVVEAVCQGILAAWAYAESISDVRALMAGGKIPAVKTAANWQVELAKLSEVSTSSYQGEENGLSYEEYLGILLYTQSGRKLAYRGMDLIEWTMQKQKHDMTFRMDHMAVKIGIGAEYEADVLFAGIFQADTPGGYSFRKTAEYAYQ